MLPPVKIVDTANGRFMLFSGSDLISAELISGRRWEPVTAAVAKALLSGPGSRAAGTVVDAGANLGAFSIPLALEVAPEFVFHCFEIQRVVFYQLCGNVVLNQRRNIHPHHVGLGDTDAAMDVPVPDYMSETNIGAVSASAEVRRLRGESATDHGSGAVEKVAFRTLDSFGFADVRLLKVDVEGMEMEVLRGARQTLERSQFPPVLLEVWNAEKRPQFAETVARLLAHVSSLGYGYQIVGDLCLAQVPGRPNLKLRLDDDRRVLKLAWELP